MVWWCRYERMTSTPWARRDRGHRVPYCGRSAGVVGVGLAGGGLRLPVEAGGEVALRVPSRRPETEEERQAERPGGALRVRVHAGKDLPAGKDHYLCGELLSSWLWSARSAMARPGSAVGIQW